MRSKKHVLEFFKNDPWPVRMGVLVIWLIFSLALVVYFSEGIGRWPILALLIKRLT